MTTIPIQLTEEQQSALSQITDWLDHSQRLEFKLGGYAGTGKTTLIKALKDHLNESDIGYEIAAFTGKAVNVLQKKGLTESSTLHSLMYDCVPTDTGGVIFILRRRIPTRPSLLIIDEASMVSSDLYRDLLTFSVKLLFIGDPGQLEPVGDNPNLMRQPDFTLSKIHRQAAESPIINFANDVRLGKSPYCMTKGDLVVRNKHGLRIPDIADASQVICAKNKTRRDLNSKFRLMQQRPNDSIQPGDKIIVLRNNRDFMVFNGMILFITEIHEDGMDYWIASCKDETDKIYHRIPIWKLPFQTELPKEFQVPRYYRDDLDDKGSSYVIADFAYAITCHKSQGSEWPHVVVFDEWMPPQVWDMKRWRYTAITRASEKLTYCL